MVHYGLSSNAFSHDTQVSDAINYLTPSERLEFHGEFPEYESLIWSGSWVDTDASGVDQEYMQWVTDWIEQNTSIRWEDGEPWRYEDGE